MDRRDGIDALRRANPRGRAGFDEAVETAQRVRTEVLASVARERVPARARLPRRRVPAWAASVALTAAAGVAVAAVALPGTGSSTGPTGGGTGAQDPAASLRLAAQRTAVASVQSGTATVRLTKDGQSWAGQTVKWNGDDISLVRDEPASSP